jgi:hypothetical protein
MSEWTPGTAPSSVDRRLRPSVEYIARVQREDGLIPWYPRGPADTWDHVESAMGLSLGGRERAARRAYGWLADTQGPEGGWWAAYGEGEGVREETDGEPPRKETHRTAYVAVGAWLHYRVTGDRAFLRNHWPTVREAVEFALAHQTPSGEVYWAVDADGDPHEDALISGCASIYKSLECAARIAETLGNGGRARRWLDARARLGTAIRERPDRFDRTWASKSRYAMDWFYPVLCGVYTGEPARERLAADADRFVEEGLGCRCVADEPWVTVAESCELAAALAAVGRDDRARELFEWLFEWTDDDGVFWTGYQFEDGEFWPGERPTWTAGAALLAADAIADRSPASGLFTDHRPE